METKTTTKKKVLIVDDSQLIHTICKGMLMRHEECVILDAADGYEALKILSREESVDLIILDINMPGMNGIELIGEIKKNNLCKDIPIIVLSTDGRDEDIVRARKAGAWAFVKKSKSEIFAGLIEDALTKKSSPLERFQRKSN